MGNSIYILYSALIYIYMGIKVKNIWIFNNLKSIDQQKHFILKVETLHDKYVGI